MLNLPRRPDLKFPCVMGVLNVTPDSFSDGGRFAGAVDAAVAHALQMVDDGAGIIDVGGESTRPGAEPVSEQDELDRVLPVIEALRRRSDVVISIDTSKAGVMRQACHAGADLINDVYALRSPGALEAAVESNAVVCLMHMRGEPRTMQSSPRYEDVIGEVRAFLAGRVQACLDAGIPVDRIVLDPGIGFGKTLAHNLALLANLASVSVDGLPVLVGVSRKSMFGQLLDRNVSERLPAGLAVAALAVWQGAAIVRAHDVRETVDAVRTAGAIKEWRENH